MNPEIEQTRSAVALLEQTAAAFSITSPDDVAEGTELLESVKQARQTILARKEEITRPAMQSLAAVRDLFRPLEEKIAKAEKQVKQALLEYNESNKKSEPEEDAPRINTRLIPKVKIVKESLIPREYLIPNLPLITEALMRKGLKVPGAKIVKEKIVVK